jgi:flagellar M-ring protein FliF
MPDALKRITEAGLQLQRLLLSRTTSRQRWWMGAALAGALAMSGGLMFLSTRTEWRVLYRNLDPTDGQQAAAELAIEKIPYQFDADGSTLRVPTQFIDKARLGLAAKGLPQSGRLGFELFDKPNWVGSEFDEKVNYQRALEGELEHTISSMGAIQSARVHLVLPHDSLFESEQRLAKASVVIKLTRRSLPDIEADSIRTLVASAIDGLDPNNVTLVDADGHVSFGQKDAQTQTALYEQQLEERLMATLEPVAGRDNIRASVHVDYDSSNQEETQEVYDPKGTVMASTQRADQSTGAGQPKAAGIPGTASNAPNAGGASNGSAPANPLPLFPPQTTNGESSHQENTSFLASKSTRHVLQGPGQVKRLTVAILVNDKLVTAGSGKDATMKFVSRSPEELQRIQQLARAAVGVDTSRGDQIAIEDIAFAGNVIPKPQTLVERFIPRKDHVIAVSWLIGPIILFLLLFFFVFRPAGRHIAQQVTRAELSAPVEAGVLADSRTPPALHDSAPEFGTTRPVSRAQMLRASVAGQIAQEPAPVVRLVKSWITDTGVQS